MPKENTREMIDIADDGTMDTVVVYNGKLCESFELRYCSEFRFSFDSDEQFLDEIADEITDEVYDFRRRFEQSPTFFAFCEGNKE
jgi:hypothetical protein